MPTSLPAAARSGTTQAHSAAHGVPPSPPSPAAPPRTSSIMPVHAYPLPLRSRQQAAGAQPDLRRCQVPAQGSLPRSYEVVRHQSPDGVQTRVMGQRNGWGRFHAKDIAGKVHAVLKPIRLDNGGTVWMEGIHAGLQGGNPDNLGIASVMLSAIRQHYYHKGNYKSDNKYHTRADEEAETERLLNAKADIEKVLKEGASPLSVRGHNCGQLLDIAKAYGEANGWSVHGVGTGPTGELHGFAVIGLRPEQLPDDFSQWPEDLAICDPWANIACAARDYPAAFEAKMQKWANAGKEIFDGDRDDWVQATDADWISAVLHGPKTLD